MSVDNLEDIQYGRQYHMNGAEIHNDTYDEFIKTRVNPIIVTVTSNQYRDKKYVDEYEVNPWIYMTVENKPGIEFETQWKLFKKFATLIDEPVIIKSRSRFELLLEE